MKTAVFCAGLGDVIRGIYLTAAYQALSETDRPMHVIVASHNPYAMEIFRHHRNARHFVLHDLGHKFLEFCAAGLKGGEVTRALCEFAGADPASIVRGKARPDFKPQFDAPDDIDSRGHIVFCPFSGNVAARTFAEEFTARVVEVLRRQPRPVFLVTRSFPRKSRTGVVIHGEEDARRYAGGNIQVLEHLTVPATLNLTRHCAAFVGSWSSMHQAAWLENRPVAVFYPPGWKDVTQRNDYAFGLDRADTMHSDFASLDEQRLETWLSNKPHPES